MQGFGSLGINLNCLLVCGDNLQNREGRNLFHNMFSCNFLNGSCLEGLIFNDLEMSHKSPFLYIFTASANIFNHGSEQHNSLTSEIHFLRKQNQVLNAMLAKGSRGKNVHCRSRLQFIPHQETMKY